MSAHEGEKYVLYYTHGVGRSATLWYARRAPGDGGVDWEITKQSDKAGQFSFELLQEWVALRGKAAGWRLV